MGRLVVVSNRVPALDREATAGGLAAALEETGGLWFGWSGQTAAEPSGSVQIRQTDMFTLATFNLSEVDCEGFYEGLANRALWPLFHNRLDLTTFNAEDYGAYRRVNRLFAEKLHALLAPDDAPSTLAVIGRYILQPEVFEALEDQKPGTGGEIQLTDAIAQTLGRVPLHVVRFEGQRFDCGNKLGFVEANVAFALARPDLKDDVITRRQRHGLGLQA